MASIYERPGKDGKTVYRVQVPLKGFPIERATFYKKTEAKKWVQRTEAAMREVRDLLDLLGTEICYLRSTFKKRELCQRQREINMQ